MTSLAYALVCPCAYLVAGSLKFAINSLRHRAPAFGHVGLGGFPSTHTSIVAAGFWMVALRAGIDTPAFAVATGLLLVVMIDAMDLRRKLEKVHRVLKAELPQSDAAQGLRDRVGHTPFEVGGGFVVGGLVALAVNLLP